MEFLSLFFLALLVEFWSYRTIPILRGTIDFLGLLSLIDFGLHVVLGYLCIFKYSSSLRPGTKGFTCGKWIIAYNFGIDDGAEYKFGAHKELIFFNI